MVPVHSPVAILGRYWALSASLAWWLMASMAPWVSMGQRAKAMLAECQISLTAKLSVLGRSCPPWSSATASDSQPPSMK